MTQHPTAEWAVQQIVEAFPGDTAPRFLIRDRDGVYGDAFRQKLEAFDIKDVVTSRKMPMQNAYYNEARPHESLGGNSPVPRSVEAADRDLISAPVLGGLHHTYRRAA